VRSPARCCAAGATWRIRFLPVQVYGGRGRRGGGDGGRDARRRLPAAGRHGERGVEQAWLMANESVPIQLAQCWFPALAISSAKI